MRRALALVALLAAALPFAGCQDGLPRVDEPLAFVAPPFYDDPDFLAAPRPSRRAYAVDGLTGEELVRRSDLVMREAGEVRYTVQHERFSISPPPERVIDPDSGELIDPSEGVITADVEGLRGNQRGLVASISDRHSGGVAVYRDIMQHGWFGHLSVIREARILGEGSVDGAEAWAVWYEYVLPGFEGSAYIWATEWIAKDDQRLLRQVRDSYAPYSSPSRRTLTVVYD